MGRMWERGNRRSGRIGIGRSGGKKEGGRESERGNERERERERECWESRVNRGKEARGWLFQAAPRGCPSALPWQPTLKHPAVVAPSGFAFR